jgi:hypothetical protein
MYKEENLITFAEINRTVQENRIPFGSKINVIINGDTSGNIDHSIMKDVFLYIKKKAGPINVKNNAHIKIFKIFMNKDLEVFLKSQFSGLFNLPY